MQAAQKACKLVMEEAGLNLSEQTHLRHVLRGKHIELDLDEWLKSPQAHTSWSWGLAALQHPITDLCAHTSLHLGVGTSSYVLVEAQGKMAPSRVPSPMKAAPPAGETGVQADFGEGRARKAAAEEEGAGAVPPEATHASSGEGYAVGEGLATTSTSAERVEEEAAEAAEAVHAEFPFGDPNQRLQYFSCCRASDHLQGFIIPPAQVRPSTHTAQRSPFVAYPIRSARESGSA